MCNGTTTKGTQCTRKADWCKTHLGQKPAEPINEDFVASIRKYSFEEVAAQKNEEPELIQICKEIVKENIVPMSPNNNLVQLAPTIVDETKIAPIKKIFDEFECLVAHQGDEYNYWIDKCALGKAEVSYKLLTATGDYTYDTMNCRVLQVYKYIDGRVKSRSFVWFYNPVDLFAFIKFFHSDKTNANCQFECHEVFLGRDPTIKLFFDIEKIIPTEFYNGLVKENGNTDAGVGEMICRDVMTALCNTLEEYDGFYERYESMIDYAIVSRSRAVNDEETKVSYHMITNVAMRVSECKALVKALKTVHLGTTLTMSDEYRELLCGSSTIDTNPYRKNGTLSLPGGRKGKHQLMIVRTFKDQSMNLHLTETYDCLKDHEFSDELPVKSNQSDREAFEESSSEFIKKALAKLTEERVTVYSETAMDLYANSPRGNYLRVKRTAPSFCIECKRTHDHADTLLLIFYEAKEVALWKCAHNEDMKAKRWFGKSGQKEYEIDAVSDDDIESFAKTLATRAAKAEEAKKAKEAEEAKKAAEKSKEKSGRMSTDDAIRQLPMWDIVINKDVVPPIHDAHNPCCYSDYLTLSQKPLTGKEAMKYIYNNWALILDGGNSFFISKNFQYRMNGNRQTHDVYYQYLKYKAISHTPGGLQVKLINPETKKEENHFIPIWRMLFYWQNDIAYSKIRFMPYGAKLGYDWSDKRVFNTFTGFIHKYDSKFVVDEDRFALYLKHIREAWCNDDTNLYDFTIKLFAYMVQFLHLKTAIAMIVMGPEGLGKNFVMELWRDHVIGDSYFVETPSIDAITGKFNSQLERNLMIVLNEAAKVGKAVEANKAQEVVKDLTTEKHRRYERKGHDAYMGDCYNNIIMFSNNDYVVRASTEMRRFVFYRGSGRFIGKQKEHFSPIQKDFESNDAGIHLYHNLMNIDLTDFHPQRCAPTTKAKEELKLAAIEKPIQWLIASLNNETEHTPIQLQFAHDAKAFYSCHEMLTTYNEWLESVGERPDATLKSLSKILSKYFGDHAGRKQYKGIRHRGFELSIDEMKAIIAKTIRRDDLFE